MKVSHVGVLIGTAALAFCVVAHGQSSPVDLSFDPGADNNGGLVENVLQQRDGKILVCGNFTSFRESGRAYVVRLNADGTVDLSFSAHPAYWVRHMSLQSDGKIILGGFFKNVNEFSRNCQVSAGAAVVRRRSMFVNA